MAFTDLLESESTRPVIPGINAVIYILPTVELDSFPAIDADFVMIDHVTKDFTFVATQGKGYFRRCQFKPKSGNTSEEKIGDVGTDGFKNKVAGILYGSLEETTVFLNNCRNIGLIVGVKDNNGIQKVTGTKDIPCYLTVATRVSGNQVGDTPGPQWQVEFECDAIDPAYIYEGTFNITPND